MYSRWIAAEMFELHASTTQVADYSQSRDAVRAIYSRFSSPI